MTGLEAGFALFAGAAIGLLVGMLGAGGSIVTVPALMLILGLTATEATGTSLVIVAIISTAGLVSHARAARVDWRAGAVFGGLGVPASVAGGYLSVLLSDRVLTTVLVVLLVGIAAWMWRRHEPTEPPRSAPAGRTAIAGLGAGLLTGTLGVGGGFAIVPVLTGLLGMPIAVAVGTSQLVLVANSLAGLVGRAGSGVVDLVLAVVFAVGGALGAVVASRFVGRVSGRVLTRLFAGLLVVVAVALAVDLAVSVSG